MPSDKGPLSTAWLVGGLTWQDKGDVHDWATATVARTKTAARRFAERRLARNEYRWAKHGERADGYRAQDHKRRDWPIREYAEWAAEHGGPGGVIWRDWLTLRDGITIHGPRGEAVHITEATQIARRGVLRAQRESDAFMASMVGAMRTGLGK